MIGGLGLLLAAGLASPAFAQEGSADGTGLSANLELDLLEEEILHLNEQIAQSAVNEPGHDADDLIGLAIDEDFLGLTADVIASESTWDDQGTAGHAEIAGANLRLADTEILHADVLTADAICPPEGEPSADAQVAGLRLLGEAIDVDADLPSETEIPVELDVEGVADADVIVSLDQVEQAGADDARAVALIIDIDVRAELVDEEIVRTSVGEIVLAEANCTRPSEVPADDNGTPGDDNGTPGDDNGTPGDDNGTPGDDNGTTDDDDNGVLDDLTNGDDNGDDPSADGLTPGSGPADGGTEVTVDGSNLDETDTVTIGGTEVDFEVGDDTDTLTFTTPGGEPGSVEVQLTYDDGSTDELEFVYESEVLAAGETAGDDNGMTDSQDGSVGAAGDARALPATGSEATTGIAFAMLLLASGAWLLAVRRRPAPIEISS